MTPADDIPSDELSMTYGPARTSPWAVSALLCSFAVCCLPMTLLAPLLGLRALVQIRANPAIRGRGMAISGITIAGFVVIGWVLGFWWWHIHARIPMLQGPREELAAGYAGDLKSFKAGFFGDGATASDAEAAEFIAELSRRYGSFIDSAQSPISTSRAPLTGPAALRIPYTFQFDQGPVEAEAQFVTFGPSRGIVPHFVFKWKWIHVSDPLRGDLVYPVSATAETLAKPPAASQFQPGFRP